jgi:hypothetical protein
MFKRCERALHVSTPYKFLVGCSVQKSGEDRFLFYTPGRSLWQNKLWENLEQSTFSSMMI